jgi:hypothetical protein
MQVSAAHGTAMCGGSKDQAAISTGSKQLVVLTKMAPTPVLAALRCFLLGVSYSSHLQLRF